MVIDVERLEPGHRLELYISPDCPYCKTAMEHYDGRGYPFETHDAQNDPDARKRMFAFTGNDPTVPAIIVDGLYVQSGWGHPPRG